VKADHFLALYTTLGQCFIAGGDYNAKHSHWGSRLITPKGRELFKAMQMQNLEHFLTGQPTYWPTDKRKVPDLDFAVIRRIPPHSYTAESTTDLTSDHSPVFITLNARYIPSPGAHP